jgi:hypothetical protein
MVGQMTTANQHHFIRKSMIIGVKNTDLQRLTGRLKLSFGRNREISMKPG